MFKKKTKKQIPKLENVGKLLTAAIVVPLISSLFLYWFNTAYGTTLSPKTNSQKTIVEEVKTNTASRASRSDGKP